MKGPSAWLYEVDPDAGYVVALDVGDGIRCGALWPTSPARFVRGVTVRFMRRRSHARRVRADRPGC